MVKHDAVQVSGRVFDKSGWLIVIGGLISLYGPTYWDLAHSLWRNDEEFHGAIVLVVAGWLVMRPESHLLSGPCVPVNGWGTVLLTIGLFLYLLGRSQEILLFEVGSQIPVFAATLLLMHGFSSLRAARFALFFLIFMLPLPGILIDSLTGPLKQWISYGVEHILYDLGYPIARQGVVLSVGQYQLLIADACSGLGSMFSLAAMGLLFMHLIARPGITYKGIMLASIVPIAFLANMARVVALVLVTYYFGDDAGQGFMHRFAGMLLFISALSGFFFLDFILSHLIIDNPVST
ncbi:MAG: exosortase B [Methylococcales bacterium]